MIYSVRKYFNSLKQLIKLFKCANEIGFNKLFWLVQHFEITIGHLQSAKFGKSIDNNDNPIPWYTYSSIEYLKQFDFKDKTIFEYGSGNSSIFWAERAKLVTSIEVDENWFNEVDAIKRSNQELYLKKDKTEYVDFIKVKNENYDVIIIDGSWRLNCAVNAVEKLKHDGFIILDNSDWYPNTAKFIRDTGMLQVDFMGLGPINYYTWTTSIFFNSKMNLIPINNRQPQNTLGGLVQQGKYDFMH